MLLFLEGSVHNSSGLARVVSQSRRQSYETRLRVSPNGTSHCRGPRNSRSLEMSTPNGFCGVPLVSPPTSLTPVFHHIQFKDLLGTLCTQPNFKLILAFSIQFHSRFINGQPPYHQPNSSYYKRKALFLASVEGKKGTRDRATIQRQSQPGRRWLCTINNYTEEIMKLQGVELCGGSYRRPA